MTTATISRKRKVRTFTRRIPRIAAERGVTARELLIQLYAKHGNQTGMAKELGVSQATISLEMLRQGLK